MCKKRTDKSKRGDLIKSKKTKTKMGERDGGE